MLNRLHKNSKEDLPVGFADLHCHALAGADDGAKNEPEMKQMLLCAYRSGIRTICFTPHYRPALFHSDPAAENEAFLQAVSFTKEELPELHLYLGNEIYYGSNTALLLRAGSCRTLGGTRFALVEFSPTEEFSAMRSGLFQLASEGFRPILAHAERSSCLYEHGLPEELHDGGILLQGNVSTLTGRPGTGKKFLNRLIREGVLDLVAGDCHNRGDYTPGLSAGYAYVKSRFGREAADALFIRNPLSVLNEK